MIIIKKNGEFNSVLYQVLIGQSAHKIIDIIFSADKVIAANIDKAIYYCFLEMSSGFNVVKMTASLISAFFTPSSLFEWLRIHFGGKECPTDLPTSDRL